MRWWWWSAGAMLGAAALLVAGCDFLQREPEIRYRITVEIDTPAGPRIGSGVWSMTLRPGDIAHGYNARFRGEAIPFDLPNGRTVFALLNIRGVNNKPIKGEAGMLPEHALGRRYYPNGRYPEGVGLSRVKQIEYLKEHNRDRIRLDCEPRSGISECPLLVSFRNSSDPSSIFAFDPNDLARDIGSGHSLKGIFLQITDDEPSRQLGNRLPWLSSGWDQYIGRAGHAPAGSLASMLNLFSFRRWDK